MRLLRNLFKSNEKETVDEVLSNDLVKSVVDKFIQEEMKDATSIIIIWEKRHGNTKQTFWNHGGIEPAQAILSIDQLHHRIQHEGLEGYD